MVYNNNSNKDAKARPRFSEQNSTFPQNSNKYNDRESVECFWEKLNFNSDWITNGADASMITFAEKVGKYMAPKDGRDKDQLSTSQIRNVYGEIKRIQLKGFDTIEGKSAFMLLKPKVAYAEGRNRTKGLTLFRKIFDEGWGFAKENRKSYNNFCALLEAILAYHKAYGGKD